MFSHLCSKLARFEASSKMLSTNQSLPFCLLLRDCSSNLPYEAGEQLLQRKSAFLCSCMTRMHVEDGTDVPNWGKRHPGIPARLPSSPRAAAPINKPCQVSYPSCPAAAPPPSIDVGCAEEQGRNTAFPRRYLVKAIHNIVANNNFIQHIAQPAYHLSRSCPTFHTARS